MSKKKRNFYLCYFDGAIIRNPYGKMGMGAIIYHKEGIDCYISKKEPNWFNSNNVAEHLALQLIFKFLLDKSPSNVIIRGDSQMVIRQMDGEYGASKQALYYNVYLENRTLLKTLVRECRHYIEFEWIPRENNEVADSLSNVYLYPPIKKLIQ